MGLNSEVQIVNNPYNIQIKNFCMFERCDEQEQTSVYGKVYFQQDLLFPACVIYHM